MKRNTAFRPNGFVALAIVGRGRIGLLMLLICLVALAASHPSLKLPFRL